MSSNRSSEQKAPGDQVISVNLQWHETVKYAKTVLMTRSDFEQLKARWEASSASALKVERELTSRFDLNLVEGYDWDDFEMDVFREEST